MPSILVSGGLGFIGGWLTNAILRDPEAHVVVVDNLQNRGFSLAEIIAAIKADARGELEVQVVSVTDYQPDRRFDFIYHLASVVGPAAVLQHSGYVTQAIVRNTYHVAAIAMRQGARLVNVSTSEVYGGGRGGYCDEATPRVIKPGASARLEYAAAKLACEVSLENLSRRGLLDAATVRPFNVAGARQLGQGGFVLPRFVGQALLGIPLTIFGDGQQVRAFTDVRDVVKGIQIIAERGVAGEAYNVGNPSNRITIGELSDKVLAVTGSQAEKVQVDPRTIYGPHYAEAGDKFPNADKLMALGWRPTYDVEATIRSVHEFMAALPRDVIAKVAGLAPNDAGNDAVERVMEPEVLPIQVPELAAAEQEVCSHVSAGRSERFSVCEHR